MLVSLGSPIMSLLKYSLLPAIICLIIYYKIIMQSAFWLNDYQIGIKFDVAEIDDGNCYMPSMDPFSLDIMKRLMKTPSINCHKRSPLIRKSFNKPRGEYILKIDHNIIDLYNTTIDGFNCCYMQVLRETDNRTKLLNCKTFSDNFIVPSEIDFMLVKCQNITNRVIIYQEGFFFIRNRNAMNSTSNSKRFGILMFGIDSLSQFNVRRTMPNTLEYLQKHHWFELLRYNKIGDNTFPNLMAILTGFNMSTIAKICKPNTLGGLNNCPTLFNTLKQQGFYTAFAEDEQVISTFHFDKAGFVETPTDYYQRPLLLALEGILPFRKYYGESICIGYKLYAEYIYDFGKEFAQRYLGENIFGLFWINTATHNNWRGALALDDYVLNYFHQLQKAGIFQQNIVIFFSDHGRRWGFLRNRKEGFLEERLPMFFIWLPPKFRRQYPSVAKALRLNKQRLTSPYDIHKTILHLAQLIVQKNQNIKKMKFLDSTLRTNDLACPTCQSLLKPVCELRSCSKAGIIDHWCTCHPYYSLNKTDPVFLNHTQQIVYYINNYIKSNNFSSLCIPLRLTRITEVNSKINANANAKANDSTEQTEWLQYRITFIVSPKAAKFDATYQYNTKTQELQFDINTLSRLNRYSPYANCIEDSLVQKFCMCYKNG